MSEAVSTIRLSSASRARQGGIPGGGWGIAMAGRFPARGGEAAISFGGVSELHRRFDGESPGPVDVFGFETRPIGVYRSTIVIAPGSGSGIGRLGGLQQPLRLVDDPSALAPLDVALPAHPPP